MKIIFKILVLILYFFLNNSVFASEDNFNKWLKSFREYALKNSISEKTFDIAMSNVKFDPQVIQYDRYQPEFYEDTKTYINKRTSKIKVDRALSIYNQNKKLIDEIENKFSVEKELLLALMGIETNYGKYLGKMDILSSLATLSFDKRRSKFFTSELITLLQLIEKGIVDHSILYGSWAGAFGNFQFMPSTIKNYAIDYDNNNKIELKKLDDSFASAANYINLIGWKKDYICFKNVELNGKIPKKFLNTSARNIKFKRKYNDIKKYLLNNENLIDIKDYTLGIITPDKDIIPDAETLSPAYVTSSNYDLILKWNRSLRFALAVCTLKEKISNAL